MASVESRSRSRSRAHPSTSFRAAPIDVFGNYARLGVPSSNIQSPMQTPPVFTNTKEKHENTNTDTHMKTLTLTHTGKQTQTQAHTGKQTQNRTIVASKIVLQSS